MSNGRDIASSLFVSVRSRPPRPPAAADPRAGRLTERLHRHLQLAEALHARIASAQATLVQGRELLGEARARLAAARATRLARQWARDPERVIVARLTRLESGPILATLARESAAIPASPEGIARLFSLRVRQDAQLLARLFDLPLEQAERLVAQTSARDRASR